MRHYAEKTRVSAGNSRAEIEKILSKYGASGFMYGWQGQRAVIGFQVQGRTIRFHLPLPDKNSEEFVRTETNRLRRDKQKIEEVYEQAVKQRWRALALAIKAKLEAVACSITTFEEEFLAHIVLPNGQTTGEYFIPQIAQSYENKQMPPLLGM